MNKYAYMVVTEAGNPVVTSYLLPIYWKKKLAEQDADTYGGRVVRIPMPKEAPTGGKDG